MRRLYEYVRWGCRGLRRRVDAVEGLLLPAEISLGEPSNQDYRRIILFVAVPAVGFFLPSLLLAGVPAELWIPFTLAAIGAAVWISGVFLYVPRSSGLTACLAAASNALVVGGLGWLYRGYFHEIALLYILLVASHAVVHGLAPALVAVAAGPAIVPLLIQEPQSANWSDPFYSALYLVGAALIPWVGWRLAQRRANLLGTLRRASETERSRVEAILASMSDAVLAVDSSGEVVMTNAAYDRLLGGLGANVELDDERGRRLPANRWPQRRAAHGARFKASFSLKVSEGERRWFEATGGPIAGGVGPIGGVVVIRDITDRSLRRLQEEFMATASHELRTPVAALHGYLQLLERHIDPAVAPREAEYATSALSQTRRLGRLLDRLFDLARLQTSRLDVDVRPFDLVPVVRRAIAAAEAIADDQELRLESEAEALRAMGDQGRTEEVILNLLTNAINHAPEGRTIDVCVRRLDSWAEIQVQDHGRGIAAADLGRIFSRFRRAERRGTRRAGGLGLGLYLSRELVRAQGGTIDIASTRGSGTTVTVRLRLASVSRAGTGGGRKP